MQTFVPCGADHPATMRALDRQRLGKQRVETWQILNALRNGGGWANHPAVRMWRGYEQALTHYGIVCCGEWRQRGYVDNMLPRFETLNLNLPYTPDPPWLADPSVALSHKSNLIRKYPEHYQPLWPGVPDDLPYAWPKEVMA